MPPVLCEPQSAGIPTPGSAFREAWLKTLRNYSRMDRSGGFLNRTLPPPESAMKHIIAGTAGHIDHGKTALVKALTGIDADRLAEGKRRGIPMSFSVRASR